MKNQFVFTVAVLAPLVVMPNSESVVQAQTTRATISSNWGASTGGLQLRAVLVKPEFAVDEPVLVNLDVRTNQDHFVSFEDNNTPVKEFKITLTDSQGNTVPFTRYGRLIQSAPTFAPHDSYANPVVGVGPGDVLEYHFWINRMFDMTTPGDYHITFSRLGMVPGKITSNTATIKVVESTNFNAPDRNLDLPSKPGQK